MAPIFTRIGQAFGFGASSGPSVPGPPVGSTGGEKFIYNSYVWHFFTSPGTLTFVEAGPNSLEYAVVAGGGSGAVRSTPVQCSGGGGAGGYRSSMPSAPSGGGGGVESALPISGALDNGYPITVGEGGAQVTNPPGQATNGNDGGNSSIGPITSTGGGGGGGMPHGEASARNGGSGGGARYGTNFNPPTQNTADAGRGIAGQGYPGGTGSNGDQIGGGGGGAGGEGLNATNPPGAQRGGGGVGLANPNVPGPGIWDSMPGVLTTALGSPWKSALGPTGFLAGGGGGGGNPPGNTQDPPGGSGGGGEGGRGANGTAGVNHTGGGGGGGYHNLDGGGTVNGGAGGDGIVICRYAE